MKGDKTYLAIDRLNSQNQQQVNLFLSQKAARLIEQEARCQGISVSEVVERLIECLPDESLSREEEEPEPWEPSTSYPLVQQQLNIRTAQLQRAEQQIRQQQQALEELRSQLLQEQRELQALEKQTEHLALLDTLFDVAPVGMCFMDAELRFIRINSMLAALNGLPKEAHLGQKFDELFPEMAQRFAPIMKEVLETGTPILSIDLSGVPPGETETGYWLGNYYPVRNRAGQTVGVGLILADITETKRAEIALREANHQVGTILESITDAFLAIDGEYRYTYANEEALRLLHKSKEELIGHSVWEVFPGLVGTTIEQQFRQVIEQQTKTVFETYYAPYQIWMEVHLYPSAKGLSMYFRDISDRKQAEAEREQLLQREQAARAKAESIQHQLTTLFETSPVGMAFLDRRQYFVAINEALAEINGLSREQHLGHTIPELFSQSDPKIVKLFEQIYLTGEPFISTQLPVSVPGRSDRHPGYYNVYYLPNINRQGEVEGVVIYVVDVTERVRLEQGQRFLAQASTVLASSLDYQTTLEQVACLAVPNLADWCTVHVIEEDGSIEQLAVAHVDPAKVAWARDIQQKYPLNPKDARGAAYTLRTGKSELISEIPDELLVEAARDPEHLEMLRGVGFKSVMTVAMIAQEKILGVISFIGAESGRCYDPMDLSLAEELASRAALAVENARLYRLAQRDRALAESANRIKDEFLAVLSHELRTPLNPILGWTKLLRSRSFKPEMAERALETIERNAKLQTQLIEDLLDISRILQGKLSLNVGPVNLPATIEAALETVRLSAESKGIQIHTLFAPHAPLLGDPSRLQQVMWNLVSNAIKFTPSGGEIVIEVAQVGSEAQIQVSDTGRGIKRDFLPHVFEYFRQADSSTTRAFGGLGLGLAIVRHIVELHGGSVWVDSRGEDCGATFTVRLPSLVEKRLKPEPEPDMVVTPEFQESLAGLRVLAVDDDPDMRELMYFILEQEGAEVTVVESAAAVLAKLPEMQPHVLVADVGMPEVDGYALLRQIRSLSPHGGGEVRAIALTAYVGELDQQQAFEAGFQMHLAKPVEPDKLVEAIRSLAEKSTHTS